MIKDATPEIDAGAFKWDCRGRGHLGRKERG